MDQSVYNNTLKEYSAQADKVNALEHQKRLDMFTLITHDNHIPLSKKETIRFISTQMLDDLKIKAIAKIQQGLKEKTIPP